jgi:hypothetical protein
VKAGRIAAAGVESRALVGKIRRLWRESVWGGDKRTSRHPTALRPRVRVH